MKVAIQRFLQNGLKLFDSLLYRYPKANLDIKNLSPKNFDIFLYSSFGDIALLSSFTQYIKHKYPDCHINLITSKKCHYIASLNPDIEQIVDVNFPRFWTYEMVERIKQTRHYDIFLNASFYPNLRHLIPMMPLVEVPFFLFRDRPDRIPTPRLRLDFKTKKKKYLILNFEAGTLGWHKNMIANHQIKNMIKEIIETFPTVEFIINNSFGKVDLIGSDNLKIFAGSFKNLLRLSANSSGIISMRNGLNDVLAASTKIPQYVIYPQGNFPDEDGMPVLKWGSMVNSRFDSITIESLINKNKPSTIKDNLSKIKKFIKNIFR